MGLINKAWEGLGLGYNDKRILFLYNFVRVPSFLPDPQKIDAGIQSGNIYS